MALTPRSPELKAKTDRLTLVPKPGWEEKIRWFKEWCVRNNMQVSDVLYEKVEDMARLHGFPDGHSQTRLDYADKPGFLPRWKTCRLSNGRLVKGCFVCSGRYVIEPRTCEYKNGQSNCYRG